MNLLIRFGKETFVRAGNYTYDAPEFKTLINDLKNDRTIIGFSRFSLQILI